MPGRLIKEDLLTKYSIIDPNLPEGQKLHAFLLARAKALASKYIDFDKTPVTFVLSDLDEPNAFYAPAFNPEKAPERNDFETVRYIKNSVGTPVICVTRGLVEMADTLDELDFVLGHELTHMLMRQYQVEQNSKGEEEIADLHAVSLMYDAGSDPKQSLTMSEKIAAYAHEQKKKKGKRPGRSKREREKEEGVNWSSIFDVHMTEGNRRSGLEAALTKLSHLIDNKRSTPIDKGALDVRYNDPVDTFLKEKKYEGKKSIGKLKILIDCLEHLSINIPATTFFPAAIKAASEVGLGAWQIADEEAHLQKALDERTNYFNGPVIEKKYQQKIANLAEEVIAEVDAGRQDKRNSNKPAAINGYNLNVYLHNKAYKHIYQNGYPQVGDYNYRDATGIMYSYFCCLLSTHGFRKRQDDDEIVEAISFPRIENDIEALKSRIRAGQSAEEFTQSVKELNKLDNILREIRTIKFGTHGGSEKLDNLSSISEHRPPRYSDDKHIYGVVKGDCIIPWDYLVSLAQTDKATKKIVVQFLKDNGIEDYRITHELPYVSVGYSRCYKITKEGKTAPKETPRYELDFAVNRGLVLETYDYIKKYFDSEVALTNERCADVLTITADEFSRYETCTEEFNKRSVAQRKIYDFLSVFNALPETKEDGEYRDNGVITLIPEAYQASHHIPGIKRSESGFRERAAFKFDSHLLNFDNPIFQDYFGKDFEKQLFSRKEQQQQQMFDTAFGVIKKAIDIWLIVKPISDRLEERDKKLCQELWAVTDEAQKDAIQKKREKSYATRQAYKEREEQTQTFISNILHGILQNDSYWYQLQRLTPEQEIILAEFAIRDKSGAISKLFRNSTYEYFGDFLNILEGQTDRAIAGNYQLTDRMQLVADKYHYHHATTKEALKAFVVKNFDEERYTQSKSYAWYMNIFDVLQYLEKSPAINVRCLAISLEQIEQKEGNSRDRNAKLTRTRYENYRKFILQSNIMPLTLRAINFEENYADLSSSELIDTADVLMVIKDQMKDIFLGNSEYNYFNQTKKKITPEQEEFLLYVEKTIKTLLRKAEDQILKADNALGKIEDLYGLHNQERKYSDKKRSGYLKEINKNEDRLKRIETLSADRSFWPEDVYEHIKAFVYAKKTFLDDKDLENKILNNILDKLGNLPAGKKKNSCFYVLLDKNLRASYPETRERLFALYVQDVSGKLGKDDGSESYRARLSLYLKALHSDAKKTWTINGTNSLKSELLSNAMSPADRYLLLRRLSDEIVSQEQASQLMKESCQIRLNSDDMARSYLYGIGIDYLTEEMDRDSDMAHKFIQFLNSKGEQKNCDDISLYIEVVMQKRYANYKEYLDPVLRSTRPSNCKILYENFWSAPLEARAIIISRMLKSAVSEDSDNQVVATQWEKAFDLVMDNLISPNDFSTEAKYARSIMHSYIKCRSDYERVLIMSAMMIANRNIGNDAGNIGKALKLFLENMGPAEIKLGQAVASHPDTPEKIRAELQHLKSSADVPARWTLFDWIKMENIPEELWKGKYLGKVLGSASYYTTAELADHEVLRILRPEAREKADKGFRVISLTIDDLREKEGTSDLSYQDLTSSVQEMVIQAALMSNIETDHTAGQQQYEFAKKIYNGMIITSDEESFSLRVMDWRAKGKNWIIMNRAKGQTFNDLPEDTPDQMTYKRRLAKGYIALELKNILSGKKFDHDRHGAQLSVDIRSNSIGIYDTGAMALYEPTLDEQKLLGNIIYVALKSTIAGSEFSSFSNIIGQKIEQLHEDQKDTRYLVEVKKGLLALGDFFKVLTAEDIKHLLPSLDLSIDVSKTVYQGIVEKMSLLEKAQFQAGMAMQSARKNPNIIIKRNGLLLEEATNVINFDVAPSTKSKSSWLQEAFSKPDNDDTGSGISLFLPFAPGSNNALLCKLGLG